MLKIVYFICNCIGLIFNFIDFGYYRFSQSRLTYAALDVIKNEKGNGLFIALLKTAIPIIILLIVVIFLWVFLYNKVKNQNIFIKPNLKYIIVSLFYILVFGIVSIVGIRGDYRHSSRPINLLDASRHVATNAQADLVLNSTFSFLRTIGKNTYKEKHFYNQNEVENLIHPIKQFSNLQPTKKNVVVFILESFSKEYIGFLNKNSGINGYQGYTPFLDSLSKSCLYFTNAYANGRQSIHGMSSVLAGVPSFEGAFTSSIYVHQPIESAISIANKMHYKTNFFHGAYNGSMGFLGFGNILGIQQYFGKDNYANEKDFDGTWGIWDDPFMQYMKGALDTMQTPFLTTIFSLSSHHPFNVPNNYTSLPNGTMPIDKCVRYTDIALSHFFSTASKTNWFKNTIFIITADHCNVPFYKEYNADINRFAIPIIIYDPNGKLPIGEDTTIAQQLDIYPTIAEIIGYNLPFRSWGRSLLQQSNIPYAINSNGKDYNLVFGNYLIVFDGENVTQIFNKSDIYKTHNLINTNFPEKEKGIAFVKSFIQDYMYRIIEKKLDNKQH